VLNHANKQQYIGQSSNATLTLLIEVLHHGKVIQLTDSYHCIEHHNLLSFDLGYVLKFMLVFGQSLEKNKKGGRRKKAIKLVTHTEMYF